MKLLGWNYRGICNASTVRALKAQIKGSKPDLIFLSETKATVNRMDYVRISIKFDHMFVVEAKDKAGGLCVLWKAGLSVKEVEFSKNLIAVKISKSVCEWLMVGFYGIPYYSKKKKVWECLLALLESHQEPWMCFGDFNFVLNEDEALGGKKGSSSTNYLKELMFKVGAIDLGYSGGKYTWAKGKWGNASVKRRLDRVIANISWRLANSKVTMTHLGVISFDHAPIILDTNPLSTLTHRPFRFEVVWLRDERCSSVIDSAWNEECHGSDFIKLCKKQATTRDALKKWNKEVFGRCQDRINSLIKQINAIQREPPSIHLGDLEASLQAELSEWLLRSEALWRQKSRELWLKLGDKNTKFFHLSTIIRRKRNSIDAIRDDNGVWITEGNSIRNAFLVHFKNLFQQNVADFPPHLGHLVLPCITEDENSELNRIPTPDEIKSELFGMQDLKAPGPDGFLAIFYKKCWPTVSDAVINAVTSFFTKGTMPREVNCSLIVLIPKISNPSTVNHFRPISLCNVIYKIISKLLTTKLRLHLDKIISPAQSAFIPNRWIAENQVIVQEILHSFKPRKTKPGLMAIKIDLQKAYDRVSCSFIHAVLLHLGFNEVFSNWILSCLTSVSFEVLVNGGKSESFKPSRGLRQGDPLSSYLFLLGQEILSRMLDHELRQKSISGIRTGRSGPIITHVMYANDIILFSKASKKDATSIARTLDKYCLWSGQQVNKEKSGILFSKHT